MNFRPSCGNNHFQTSIVLIGKRVCLGKGAPSTNWLYRVVDWRFKCRFLPCAPPSVFICFHYSFLSVYKAFYSTRLFPVWMCVCVSCLCAWDSHFHLLFSTDKEQCKYELHFFLFQCMLDKQKQWVFFFLAHSWWSYFKYAIWVFKLKSDCNFVWPNDFIVKIALEEKWNPLIGMKLVNKIDGIPTEISQQCIVFFWFQSFTTICQEVIEMTSKQAQTHYKNTCAVQENSTTPHLGLHRLTLTLVRKSGNRAEIQRQPNSR